MGDWRVYRFCKFPCGVEDSANVMLTLHGFSFVGEVSYRPQDGFVRYEIDLASRVLGGGDGQCAEEMIARELHKVVALHSARVVSDPSRTPEAA